MVPPATLAPLGSASRPRPGKVWLVGAGPGDPELLTLKAARLLSRAQVVAYDELISPEILALAPRASEKIAVGRRAHGPRHHDERVHPLVVERARAGKRVVRLKGGDPFIFGRGGEECEALAEAEIPFEIVPGVTVALGAAASTHVPLTHRDVSSSVTFVTAHAADGSGRAFDDVPRSSTLVIYMGLGRLGAVARELVARGRPLSTPALVVSRACSVRQREVWSTLAAVEGDVAAASLEAPAILIVGDVVGRAVASPTEARSVAAVLRDARVAL